jgi:hypothetical protein
MNVLPFVPRLKLDPKETKKKFSLFYLLASWRMGGIIAHPPFAPLLHHASSCSTNCAAGICSRSELTVIVTKEDVMNCQRSWEILLSQWQFIDDKTDRHQKFVDLLTGALIDEEESRLKLTPRLINLQLFVISMISIIEESFRQDATDSEERIRRIANTVIKQTNVTLDHLDCFKNVLHRTLTELLYLDYDEDLRQSWFRFLRSIFARLSSEPALKLHSTAMCERLHATSSNSVKFT